MRHRWLLAALVLFSASATAGTAASPDTTPRACRAESRQARTLWQQGLFDTSPAVARAMLAAFEGRTADMRRDLTALPKGQRKRWRGTALATAVAGNRPGTVAALLDDGVDPDTRNWIPPLKSAFYRHLVGKLRQDPQWHGHGRQVVEAMRKDGVIGNHGTYMPPPLFTASQCHLEAVAKVLVDHGASVSIRERQANGGHGADPLTVATVFGDAPVVRLLLAHGAAPCAADRHMAQRARETHRHAAPTLAGIGRKSGLPAPLVARLQCHAP